MVDLALTLRAVIATAVIAPTTVTGSAGPLVVIYALVTVAVLVWFLVFLWTIRDDPALGSPSSRREPDPVL